LDLDLDLDLGLLGLGLDMDMNLDLKVNLDLLMGKKVKAPKKVESASALAFFDAHLWVYQYSIVDGQAGK
jgi:hypothetical protein